MNLLKRHIRLFLGLAAVMLSVTSCYDVRKDREVCDYNIQLLYHYNAENTSKNSVLTDYVNRIEEFVFDEQGVLYAKHEIDLDECRNFYASEQEYEPGRYSVVAIGNRRAASEYDEAVVGVTHREHMLLSMVNPGASRGDDGMFGNGERLYYGYRTFTIEPTGISRVHVDLVHSHLVLNYRVIWKKKAPVDTGALNIRISTVPAEYGMVPEYVYPEIGRCEVYDPLKHDAYNKICQSVRHYIPTIYNNPLGNIVTQRQDVSLTGTTLIGQAIGYRLRTPPGDTRREDFVQTTFEIYDGDRRIANPVPLNDFLTAMGEKLDQTLKQEYSLVFEVDEDGRVTASFANVADWDEGGFLGGGKR